MAIRISKKLQNELPKSEREGIKEFLWKKSSGRCFLCDEPMNKVSDVIVADHDVPVREGGETKRTNLNLVHSSCNSKKRHYPSLDIRPYLRLSAFIEKKHEQVYYTDCLDFFDIKPAACIVDQSSDKVDFHLPDGQIASVPVFTETSQVGTRFEFAYVALPRSAIFNDTDCQPRPIKTRQLLLIYSDLSTNPLHEAPGLRVIEEENGKGHKLLMFDGQHKSLAAWMAGRESICAKVYLNLSKDQANELVNSIQSRVKKLPLTPFELAAKMADEFRAKFEEYEKEVGADASEAGFIEWLPTFMRNNGKKEIKSAVLQGMIEGEEPSIKLVDSSEGAGSKITETTLQNKVFANLANLSPLEITQAEGSQVRSRERHNVATVLNAFDEICLEPGFDPDGSSQEQERTKRLIYQPSLDYSTQLIKKAIAHILVVDESEALTSKPIKGKKLADIKTALKRLKDHPVWTADLTSSPKLREVQDVISKNQGADKAFRDVGLTVGYVLGADELDESWDE